MSVIGCYALDLYCRYDGASHGPDAGTREHPFDYLPHQYTGPNYSSCRAQARRNKWRFDADGEVTCPRCIKQEKKA